MKTKLAIAISAALALTACDDYKLESEGDGFHSPGSVGIVGDTIEGQTLTAQITDNDGFDPEAVTYIWTANNSIRSGVTGSTYLLTEDDVGSNLSVRVEYIDNAGYDEVAISNETDKILEYQDQIIGTVDIEGTKEDGLVHVNLELSAVITDGNGFGSSEIFYTWLADNVAIEGATKSKYTLTEDEQGALISVQVKYIDNRGNEEGYEGNEIISAQTSAVQEEPANVVKSKVAELTDLNLVTPDEGEIRIKVQDLGFKNDAGEPIVALKEGKLSVMFRKAGDPTNNNPDDNDTDPKDAYIGIFGSNPNNGYSITELRIKGGLDDGSFTIRNRDSEFLADETTPNPDYIEVTSTFTEDDWVKVEITWDAADASTTVGPATTISIDEKSVTTEAFTTADSGKADQYDTLVDGVQYIKFRIGDKDATVEAKLFLDDIEIFSDVAGTESIYADDFEEYETDFDLTEAYSSNTAEATVRKIEIPQDGGDTGGGDNTSNLNAGQLNDVGDSDSGQLVYKIDDLTTVAPITKGRLTMSFYKERFSVDENGDQKDAYIGLYSEGSTSNKGALLDIRLHGAVPIVKDVPIDYGTLEQRDGSGFEAVPTVFVEKATNSVIVTEGTPYNEGVHYDLDKWHDLEVIWDASSDVDMADLTVTIDDVTYTMVSSGNLNSDTSKTTTPLLDAFNSLTLKYGDSSTEISNKVFQFDDIKIYSSDSGEEVLVFSEDFESQVVGEEPETTTSTPSKATVAERKE